MKCKYSLSYAHSSLWSKPHVEGEGEERRLQWERLKWTLRFNLRRRLTPFSVKSFSLSIRTRRHLSKGRKRKGTWGKGRRRWEWNEELKKNELTNERRGRKGWSHVVNPEGVITTDGMIGGEEGRKEGSLITREDICCIPLPFPPAVSLFHCPLIDYGYSMTCLCTLSLS